MNDANTKTAKRGEQLDLFISAEDAAQESSKSLQLVMARLPQTDWLTVSDVVSALKLSSSDVVYAWIDSGRFESLNVSGGDKPFYKILRSDFLRFLQTRVQ